MPWLFFYSGILPGPHRGPLCTAEGAIYFLDLAVRFYYLVRG